MDAFPLVLCGPIVRRTLPDSVTVWVALQKPCTVELVVYEDDGGSPGNERLRGRRDTVRLAKNLHVAAVTAAPENGAEPLAWGGRYLYGLKFGLENAWQDLYDEGVLRHQIGDATPVERLVYQGQRLPGFRLPAAKLADLRLAHGSCRKPHGAGADGLAGLDNLLKSDDAPPQILLLTGDQIYADDVDPGLLQTIIDRSAVLAGGADLEKERDLAAYRERLRPGQRQSLVVEKASFTSGDAVCHLVTLAELYTMYLFVWSDVLWDPALAAREKLSDFSQGLPKARRALANISTYMTFDDHDVTDDWNRTGRWVANVAKSELGNRIVRNALAAYAVFQHWGNDPAAFEDGGPGGNLLEALDGWDGTDGDRTKAVRRSVYVPDPGEDLEPVPDGALRWHYSIDTPEARIVSLETRTRRRFRDPTAAPGLMSNAAIDDVLDPAATPKPATIVVSPAPVLGVGLIEFIQDKVSGLIDRYKKETELITGSDKFDAEAWAFDTECYDYLLERLASLRRVVIVSGDVHYGFGASLVAKDRDARIINFVSSALHNEVFTQTVSKLLSWMGNRQLEALSDEEPPPVDVPRSASVRKGSTKSLTFEEGLLHDEPPEKAAPADRGEVDFESFPASSKRAEVVGSANFGDVTFPPGQVLHRLRWQRLRRRRIVTEETEHLATFPID